MALPTNNTLWWTTPLQVFATLGAAANFGGSAMQSPLTMPLLSHPSLPTPTAGSLIPFFLQRSEQFFPPLNAACTLSNLIVAGTLWWNSNGNGNGNGNSNGDGDRLFYVAVAGGMNLLTTIYTLVWMRPMNNRMRELGGKMGRKGKSEEAEEEEFRGIQGRWVKGNLVRAAIMLTSAVAGMTALLSQQ